MKFRTILENGTGSSIEVITEVPKGVYTLMARINPGEKHELRKDSNETYRQHWVVIENDPVLSFYSDDLLANERIKIITVGDSYSREVTPRHGVSTPSTTSQLYPLELVSFEQKLLEKLLEKPNLYLSLPDSWMRFKSAFEEHFRPTPIIEECNVGVVVILTISFTLRSEMKELVRMVEEAKRRSDFKILPVVLDALSLGELDDPGMQEHMQRQWNGMEVTSQGSIKAADCAAAYEYIRSCDCMERVNTGLRYNEFLNLVFDRIRGLISAGRTTGNLRGITPPISTKNSGTVSSSEIYQVKDWLKIWEERGKSSESADVSDSEEEERMRSHEKARENSGMMLSSKQKLVEKPNLYLYLSLEAEFEGELEDKFLSELREHFRPTPIIEECNVGVVVISTISFTERSEMKELVRMVEEAKRRSDFKILPVVLDALSLGELDDLGMQEHMQRQWNGMEVTSRGSIKAVDCAAVYEYIRLCDCMERVNTGLRYNEFLNLVFDRIRGLISAGRTTGNLRAHEKARENSGMMLSSKQKLVEKPNLYLYLSLEAEFEGELEDKFLSELREHFRPTPIIEECNVGVVVISTISFTERSEMKELVRMVEEAKRRSDFKILPVVLDALSLGELDDLGMQEHMQRQWNGMEVTSRGSIKAVDCAAVYEYIRLCDCMERVNTGLRYNEFLNLVFDRIRGLISAGRTTGNLRGPPMNEKAHEKARENSYMMLSSKQKLVEKPNLYLYLSLEAEFEGELEDKFLSELWEHFRPTPIIEECNVGVVVISTISFTLRSEMKELVRMVEEAKRRSDFKILPVVLDALSLGELDDLGMQEHMQRQWNGMEVTSRGSIKAADCAAVYEYIRSCDCMERVNTGLRYNEFLNLVFDRICGLISAGRTTGNLRGPLMNEKADEKARENSGMMLSSKQKLVEKPNLYLCPFKDDFSNPCEDELEDKFLSELWEHFRPTPIIEECNVGVVVIATISFTLLSRMKELVKMVEEAKRRSDFEILLVALHDKSLRELEYPEMEAYIQGGWDWMEVTSRGSIKAADCAAVYEYIRSCECMVNPRLKEIEFLNFVFDRIRVLTSSERNTENLRGSTLPLSVTDLVIGGSSSDELHKHSTSVNDPDWSENLRGETKNKSADVSDTGKEDAEEERMQYSSDSIMKAMKALSHGDTLKSQEGSLMIDAVHLQLDARWDLEGLVKGLEAPLEEQDWRRDAISSTHKDAGEIIYDGTDVFKNEIKYTIKRDDNLEGPNVLHGNFEYCYEAFKDQLYEDIKRIDCIEEIAIDHVDTKTLLQSHDIVILSFFDEKEDIFEFYFRNREDMASIAGVGLEHAVVILESGEVTIKEITDHNWNERWRSLETGNSWQKRKLFKMKMPTPSDAHEGLNYLDLELSYEKPLLWELAKYFSLRESIETFVTKDIFVEYAQDVVTSSSTSLKNQGEGSSVKSAWLWIVKKFLNSVLQENGNEGSTSYELEERVSKGSKDTATIVKLQLLHEEYKLIDDFPGTIKSNLELRFLNEGGDSDDGKEVQIIVGTVSFNLGRDKEGNQLPWYQENLRVLFGLLDKVSKNYGRTKDQSFKSLEMRVGTVTTKTSSTHSHTKGKEKTGKGGLSLKPFGSGATVDYEQKCMSQDIGTETLERSAEIPTDDYTKGGLILKSSVELYRIICDYSLPGGVPSLGPPSTGHFYDQFVMFEGTWLPVGEKGFVDYTLVATRDLCHKDKRHIQKYSKTMVVNHSMTHLDGKTYKLEERKQDSKSILTVVGSGTKIEWEHVEPLVEMKDNPNEVPTATNQNVDQQEANNGSIQNVDQQEAINGSIQNSSTRNNRFFPRMRKRYPTRSTNSPGESSMPGSRQESQQEVNGSTSNLTRSGPVRR